MDSAPFVKLQFVELLEFVAGQRAARMDGA